MKNERMTRHFARWVVVGAVAGGLAGLGGCLQILGDDRTFIQGGTGGGGTGGTTGGTGGVGAAGGGGTGGTTTTKECDPGLSEACYDGPDGTEDVGTCTGGMRTCEDDGTWGTCEGEITPQAEVPAVFGDEGCDGFAPQEALCAAIFGDPSQQWTQVIKTDATGAMLIVGQFGGAISFGSKTLTTHGYNDISVAKLAPDCSPLWATQIGSTQDDYPSDIAIDAEGNVIVTGWTFGQVPIGNFTVSKTILIVKLDGATGNAVWATGCGGDDQSRAARVAIDQDGAVVIAGSFHATLDCGDGPHTSGLPTQAFVAKLKASDGKPVWTKPFVSTQDATATALAVDSSNNIVAAGSFTGTLGFGQNNNLTSNGKNIFLWRLTTAGDHISSDRVGDTLSQTVSSIAVGVQGALFIAGTFQGTINMPGVGSLSNNSLPHAFLLKQLAGGSFEWGWNTTTSKGDSANSVATDSLGRPILGIEFDGNVVLQGAMFTNLGVTGSHDGLIVKVDQDGSVLWTRQLGDAPVNGVAVNADDTTAVCGKAIANLNGMLDLGTGPLDPQGDDAYVARYAP